MTLGPCKQCGSTELRQDGLGTICINGHDQPDEGPTKTPRPCLCAQRGNWCDQHPDCVCGCPRHAHDGWAGACIASSWFCAGCTVYRPGPVNPSIRIWSFWDAPPEYRRLSTSGGDEDWLAFVPASITDEPPWFEYTIAGEPTRHPIEGGTVLIWSH